MLSIDLTGKNAFITGVADDVGFAWTIAKTLQAAGANVYLASHPRVLGIVERFLTRDKSAESRKLPFGVQETSTLDWQTITSEPSGLVNISRFRKHPRSSYVLVKTLIRSEKEQVKKLTFGYSDRIAIFLNGKVLFEGNSTFLSRDPEFLGIVGLHDAVFLDLERGDNELVLMVLEYFGGWGYVCQLEDLEGIELVPGE